MPRPSEIRAFLLRYAQRRGILVKEYTSGLGEDEGPVQYFCHLEIPSPPEEPAKTSTAVSRNGVDDSLVMAFLSLLDPGLNFLDD